MHLLIYVKTSVGTSFLQRLRVSCLQSFHSVKYPKQTNVEIKVAQIEALGGMAQQKIKTNVSLSYLIFETLPIFSVHLPAMPAFLTAFVIFAVR